MAKKKLTPRQKEWKTEYERLKRRVADWKRKFHAIVDLPQQPERITKQAIQRLKEFKWKNIDEAQKNSPTLKIKVVANGKKDGWHNFDEEYALFSRRFVRNEESPCGDDPMLMLFTSGTTGYPKIATHSHKYPLGHFITAKYWHHVNPDGLHLTISDTGWLKSLWGKLYGQWFGESAVLVYDFQKFNGADILEKLESNSEFKMLSTYVKSQLRRTSKLYLEYLQDK